MQGSRQRDPPRDPLVFLRRSVAVAVLVGRDFFVTLDTIAANGVICLSLSVWSCQICDIGRPTGRFNHQGIVFPRNSRNLYCTCGQSGNVSPDVALVESLGNRSCFATAVFRKVFDTWPGKLLPRTYDPQLMNLPNAGVLAQGDFVRCVDIWDQYAPLFQKLQPIRKQIVGHKFAKPQFPLSAQLDSSTCWHAFWVASVRKHFSSGILRFRFLRTVSVPCLHQSSGRWRSWMKRKYTCLQLPGCVWATSRRTNRRRKFTTVDAVSRSRCFPQGWTNTHFLPCTPLTHCLPPAQLPCSQSRM